MRAADEPLPLEIGEVLVDGREGVEREMLGDLFKRRRKTVLLDGVREVIHDLLLSLRERHCDLRSS